MTKATALLAAALLSLGVFSPPGAAKAQTFGYPPNPVAWIVGPGHFGISGIPWPGPPFAWPILKPAYGCYFTRARIKSAWQRIEVCD